MKKILALSFTCLALFACKDVIKELEDDANNDGKRDWIPEPDANPPLTTAETIAYKNGFDKWKDVSKISFTFNVDRGERHFERSFVWETKIGNVTYMNGEDTIQYNRNLLMDSLQIAADQAFVNDKYWLLAPYQLVWDEGTTFSEEYNQIAPISKDTMDVLTITYGSEGGYTPGDAYDLYYGKDFMLREWVFREGNGEVANMTTTWEDYEDFNGLKIAKMHKDSTGGLELYFTNIIVEK
ncbi:MAG: hypothetical protein AAFP76_04855 [Bacteroidota bacterium]